jgi:hypothetical protein
LESSDKGCGPVEGFYEDGNGSYGCVKSEDYLYLPSNYRFLSSTLRHGFSDEWDFYDNNRMNSRSSSVYDREARGVCSVQPIVLP